jgi:TusA-related sulfurtransferase
MTPAPVSAPTVDARGQACPMPIVLLARALRVHSEALLWADDPATRADLLAFCAATGAILVSEGWAGVVYQAKVSAAPREG